MPRLKETVNLTANESFMSALANVDATKANKLLKIVTGDELDEPTVYQLIMNHVEELHWKLRFNTWENMPCFVNGDNSVTPFSDDLDAKFLTYFEKRGVTIPKERYRTIILGEAQEDSFHPAKEYFNNIRKVYDGVDYISLFCEKYIRHNHEPLIICGQPHDYFVFALKAWMRLAVGKLFDRRQNFCLTLDGEQDIGKTFWLRWFCPNDDWFNSEKLTILDKDVRGRTTQKFIWEIPELDATTRKTDVSDMKDFLTKEIEIWRAAYGHYDKKMPITASYCASLNANKATGFLSDPTGNRRYAVVKIEAFDHDYVNFDKVLLWQQAAFEYFADPSWKLPQEFKVYRDDLNSTTYTMKSIEQGYVCDYVWVSKDDTDTIFVSDLREALEKATGRKFNNNDAGKINTEIMKQGGKIFHPRNEQGKQGRDCWKGVKLRYHQVEATDAIPAHEILKKIDNEWVNEQLDYRRRVAEIGIIANA